MSGQCSFPSKLQLAASVLCCPKKKARQKSQLKIILRTDHGGVCISSSTPEAEARGPLLVQGQPSLFSEYQRRQGSVETLHY